ncbi:hypothetical protein CANARDRAFT_204894 [[Candida] arabinofermentans NRRL YB-2248]|uniref:5-oxoprolinase n=1 Tax=[Candida] arabinofermentans NRRL YB-2248 TaxID=983967 RepID=A0A1E4SSX8_9ASCO|nr:hypothetical protein CANARDRAFT_204894 [[Candida] arabinofermentans NRRL YB-2248]
MGTTVATNALLEKKGDRFLYVTTENFQDILAIGTQARPELFNLNIIKPEPLYDQVLQVEERVTLELASDDPNQCEVDVDADENLHQTPSGNIIRVLKPLNKEKTYTDLKYYYDQGFTNIAVCLAHSFAYAEHEKQVEEIAKKIGYEHISLSSTISPSMGILNRGNSTCIDTYLTPHVQRYVDNFMSSFINEPVVQFMKSDGGLTDSKGFNGLNSILSGPAGGVVGFSKTAYDGHTPIIGFDMGGTSTDVCRFDGDLEINYDNNIAGVEIYAPQLQIHTVAAGGGSILKFENGLFHVGPESSSAHPGPACYRKGGPLTITDANLFLGRLDVSQFPKIFGPNANESLDEEITTKKFIELTKEINEASGKSFTAQEIALGFLDVANETMSRSIREITEARGYSTQDHTLTSFGGAGGQHCCAIAKKLGIKDVAIHKYSSILSSYGMTLADNSFELREPFNAEFTSSIVKDSSERVNSLIDQVEKHLKNQNTGDAGNLNIVVSLGLKYKSSNTVFPIVLDKDDDSVKIMDKFFATHKREFGFNLPSTTPVFVNYIRVRGTSTLYSNDDGYLYRKEVENAKTEGFLTASTDKFQDIFFGSKSTPSGMYYLKDLKPGTLIQGPAMIIDKTQTILVEPDSDAIITTNHVYIEVSVRGAHEKVDKKADQVINTDPILLSVFSHRFMSIAEQMGRTLQRTSVSTSIKERLDFSCAIFGPDGGLVANAPHIPVHLGSMQYAIQYQHNLWKGKLQPGDVLVSNHPEAGGTHLPDITVITPVFFNNEIVFYVASRGHHQDIGGIGITAMSPNSKELIQEGVSILSFKLVSNGEFDEAGIRKLFDEPAKYPGGSATRSIQNNLSDLRAQISANQRGILLVEGLFAEYGTVVVQHYMNAIRQNAEMAVRDFLREQYVVHKGKPLEAVDYFDDGTLVKVKITIDPVLGEALFDFEGTGEEVYGCMNTPAAITYSCAIYTLRCLINKNIPLNQGCLTPCKFNIPKGTILNPSEFVAICGSTIAGQRITDVMLRAFDICAASQGCANSFGFGTGGKNPYTGEVEKGFTFAEAIGGGVGAGPWGGKTADCCNVHCTNTRTTDVEIIEYRTPVIVTKWEIRQNSGGRGLYAGGRGATREIQARIPLRVSILSERRVFAPYGLKGGEDGARGLNLWYRLQKDGSYAVTRMNCKEIINIKAGDRVQINTPGGGGYGTPL